MKEDRSKNTINGSQDLDQGNGDSRGIHPERRAFDRMLAAITTRCMNAPLEQLDAATEEVLKETVALFGGDRATLWAIAEDRHQAVLTHAYVSRGAEPPAQVHLQETLPFLFEKVLKFQNIIVSDMNDLPQAAHVDRQYLGRSGVRSFIVIPLLVGGAPRGALSLACIRTARTWSNADLFSIQRIGMVLASTIDRLQSHRLIDQRMQFETMIADLSADIIRTPFEEMDGEIERGLARVGEFFQADRCGLLSVDTVQRSAHVSHAYNAEGVAPVSQDINLVQLFPWAYTELADRKRPVNVTATQMKDLPQEAETDRQSWAAMGVKYNLAVPLHTGTQIEHVIVIHSLREERSWPVEYVPRLRMLGELFVNALIRMRSKMKLRKSEARLATVIDVEALGFYEMAVGTGLVYADERMRDLLGISPGEEQRAREFWLEHIHPDDLPVITEKSRRILNGETNNETAEYRYVHPSRGLTWLNQSSRVVDTDDQGRPVKLVGVFRDITARKRMDEERRRSEERLHLTAESAEAALWNIDVKSGALWTTDLGRKMFGLPMQGELTIERFLEIVHPEDRETIRERIKETLESGNESSVEYRVTRADGSVRWFLSRGRPYTATLEEGTRLMGVSIDITKRKQDEDALRQSYAEIARLKDKLEAENRYLRDEVCLSKEISEIIGRSDPIRYVHYRISQVAPLETTVLIVGETGTGKGLVAKAVHESSLRKDRPMIHVNCAVLPANLIESELFGREKGAFTGAQAKQIGRFELAHKGTLFLDEIAELPLELQSKLLRVVESGEFERLGDPHTIKIDVRIIASTNRNLEEEIHRGRFREDLFYRLSVFPITVPPLRQRTEDIPLIVEALIERLNKRLGRQIKTITRETLKVLQSYSWPGNVRELENVIERAVIMSKGPVLELAEQLGNFMGRADEVRGPATSGLADVERDHIRKTLESLKWKIDGPNGAARALGLKPSTLRDRMQKLDIRRPGST